MTNQSNLDLIWAGGGGVVDPGDAKYVLGWVTEIPTYENFNFVLQTTTTNLLSMAEAGSFVWQAEIAYVEGVRVIENNKLWTCVTANTGQNPTGDATNSYWVHGVAIGSSNIGTLLDEDGVLIQDVNSRAATTWDGNDLTVKNANAVLSLVTNDGTKNWLIANVGGVLVVADVDAVDTPDGRNISSGQSGVYDIFHQGNPPTISDIGGGVEEAPSDGIIYGRRNNTWIAVTSTIISDTPPTNNGDGSGWYNLTDGQLYIDLDDGDSIQWVLANPPLLPALGSLVVFYHDTAALALAASQQDGGAGLHVAPEVAAELIF